MSDAVAILTRIADALEKIAIGIEKAEMQGGGEKVEETKDRQETIAKTAMKSTTGDPVSSLVKEATQVAPIMAAQRGVNEAASFLSSLLDSRQAQMGLVAPADRIMGEVQQLSGAGHYLSDKDAESYGAGVAIEQQAMQYNMKKLAPYINRGTWNNIQDRLGEFKLDIDDKISGQEILKPVWDNMGSMGLSSLGSPVSATFLGIDYLRKFLQRNQGVDALGR